jgi:hypothetical protein
MKMPRRLARFSSPAFLIGTLAFFGGQPLAAEPVLPDEVRAALRDNGEQLSPVTLTFTQTFTTTIDRHEALRRIRLESRDVTEFFFESKHRVSWQGGKLHAFETRYDSTTPATPLEHQASFDGKVLYFGTRSANQPVLFKRWMTNVMKDEPASQYMRQHYLRAAGIHLPKVTEWDHPRATSVVLYQLEKGGTLDSVAKEETPGGGHLRVTVVAPGMATEYSKNVDLKKEAEDLKSSKETPARQKELLDALRRQQRGELHEFVYYLDPAQHYAVARWEEWERQPRRLVNRYDNSRFQKLPGRAVRLPQHSEIRFHQVDHMPGTYFEDAFLSEVFDVSAIDAAAISDDRFVVAFTEAGSYIRDGTLPEAAKAADGYISYTIPAKAADLDKVIQSARRGERFSPELEVRPVSGLTLNLIALNVLALAALTAFCVYWFAFRKRTAKRGT